MKHEFAISIRNASKSFGRMKAVDDISLDVHHGEIFGIIGPNGAGKTTTVNMITGMLAPDNGEVRTLGLDPIRDERRLRDVLGVQFQEANLPAAITAREALKLYASFYRNPRPWTGLAEEWGITDKLDTRFDKLSGGQKQRLFICLALLNRPKLVVLDELTTGLDPNARRMSWELVKRIREGGTTVLLVTHFMDEAQQLCDRIAMITGGKVAAIGTPEELTRASSAEREVTFTAPPAFDYLSLAPYGRVHVDGNRVTVRGGEFIMADVAMALRGQGIAPPDLATVNRSLDDLFVDLTGHQIQEVA